MRPQAAAIRNEAAPTQPFRRRLLVSAAVAWTAATLPAAQAVSEPDPLLVAFDEVSLYLTGRAHLDGRQGLRAFDALTTDDPGLPARVAALAEFIRAQRPDPAALQAQLDARRKDLADLPRKILRAWYLGVTGEGAKSRCFAFEDDLTNLLVADKLRPPSYCFGGYGSWAAKP